MALSNIFREPRREIIETVVGAVVFVTGGTIAIGADYLLATWICNGDLPKDHIAGMALSMVVIGPALFFAFWGVLHFIHQIGEKACAFLDARGHQLRPRQRR